MAPRDRAEGTGLSSVIEVDGEFVGTAGAYLRPGRLGPEIGYSIAPWARRRGYAAEAAQRAGRLGAGAGRARVHLYADVLNDASQGVARRAGFSPEGIVRSCLAYRDGTPRRRGALRTDRRRVTPGREDADAASSRPGGQPALAAACGSACRVCDGPAPFCATSVRRMRP